MSTLYCEDNCNHTGPHHFPPKGAEIGVIGMLAALTHVHEWRMVGQLADAQVLLVCPHHEPPETRTVRP